TVSRLALRGQHDVPAIGRQFYLAGLSDKPRKFWDDLPRSVIRCEAARHVRGTHLDHVLAHVDVAAEQAVCLALENHDVKRSRPGTDPVADHSQHSNPLYLNRIIRKGNRRTRLQLNSTPTKLITTNVLATINIVFTTASTITIPIVIVVVNV